MVAVVTVVVGVADRVVGAESIDEVFAEADAVVIALPGGDETTGLIGAAQLEALGEGLHDGERLLADAPGASQQADAFHETLPPSPRTWALIRP